MCLNGLQCLVRVWSLFLRKRIVAPDVQLFVELILVDLRRLDSVCNDRFSLTRICGVFQPCHLELDLFSVSANTSTSTATWKFCAGHLEADWFVEFKNGLRG